MSKTNNTRLFMSLSAMVIVSILAILKLGRHHKGVGENAGKNFDDRLKKFVTALDKATQFVHHVLQHAI